MRGLIRGIVLSTFGALALMCNLGCEPRREHREMRTHEAQHEGEVREAGRGEMIVD